MVIEEGIRPLVEALNQLSFLKTVYSCEGHFEREPDPRYLPTAYVTFGINDAQKFQSLYEDFLRISERTKEGSVKLTYDCILGRFTISAWADNDECKGRSKRTIVDSLISLLVHAVQAHPGVPETSFSSEDIENLHPCGNHIPPCALTIPVQSAVCPFQNPPVNVPRFSLHAG